MNKYNIGGGLSLAPKERIQRKKKSADPRELRVGMQSAAPKGKMQFACVPVPNWLAYHFRHVAKPTVVARTSKLSNARLACAHDARLIRFRFQKAR
jgi:hypothetical protein